MSHPGTKIEDTFNATPNIRAMKRLLHSRYRPQRAMLLARLATWTQPLINPLAFLLPLLLLLLLLARFGSVSSLGSSPRCGASTAAADTWPFLASLSSPWSLVLSDLRPEHSNSGAPQCRRAMTPPNAVERDLPGCTPGGVGAGAVVVVCNDGPAVAAPPVRRRRGRRIPDGVE